MLLSHYCSHLVLSQQKCQPGITIPSSCPLGFGSLQATENVFLLPPALLLGTKKKLWGDKSREYSGCGNVAIPLEVKNWVTLNVVWTSVLSLWRFHVCTMSDHTLLTPLTIYITNAIWTDEACNILYENAGIDVCNFWSPDAKFVNVFEDYCGINVI